MKNKILSYILLPVMILFCLQHDFAFGKTTDYRLQTTDCRLQTAGYRDHEDYLSHKTQNSTLKITQNPFGYSGYYHDVESGNYYLNARYYSSVLKRFVSRDTYDLANRYAYGDGNPIDNVDPAGHSAWSLTRGILRSKTMRGIDIASGIGLMALSSGFTSLFLSGVLDILCGGSKLGAGYTHGILSKGLNDFSTGLSLLSFFVSSSSLYCTGSTIKRYSINNLAEFNDIIGGANSENQVHLWVDLDDTLLKEVPKGSDVPEIFTKRITGLPGGGGSLGEIETDIYINPELQNRLQELADNPNVQLHILTTGKWLRGENFKFDKAVLGNNKTFNTFTNLEKLKKEGYLSGLMVKGKKAAASYEGTHIGLDDKLHQRWSYISRRLYSADARKIFLGE